MKKLYPQFKDHLTEPVKAATTNTFKRMELCRKIGERILEVFCDGCESHLDESQRHLGFDK
ncbi:hypothetical protein D3C87_1954010 [compost metagenome]